MKIIKTILSLTFSLTALFTNAQEKLDFSNLDHLITLIKNTTFDNVKPAMSQLNCTIVTEKSAGSKDQLLFVNSEKQKIYFIYENKILKKLASAVFVMTLPIMHEYLRDKGYTITSKEKVKKDNQTKTVTTWDKPNRPYKFVFSEASDFESILEIKIDASVVTDIVNLENMPPIQLFLDKIAGKEFEENMSDHKNVSQLLTNNSFTRISIHISSGKTGKDQVDKIAWKNFKEVKTYTLKNVDKYISCTFYFNNNLNKNYFSNDIEYFSNNKDNYFKCFIYAKDKAAFLKAVKDWENSRN